MEFQHMQEIMLDLMKIRNTLEFPATPDNLLPENTANGLAESNPYFRSYLERHVLPGNGQSIDEAGLLAASRLEWLLLQARQAIHTRFTYNDFHRLVNCFPGTIFHPGQLISLASFLRANYLRAKSEQEKDAVVTLAHKVAALTPLESVALADALEQAWYRRNNRVGYFEVLAELGLLPSESQAN